MGNVATNRGAKGVDIGELTAVLEAYQHQQLSSKQSVIQHTANVGYQNGLMGFISYDLSAYHLANANHVQASATHGLRGRRRSYDSSRQCRGGRTTG